MPCILSPLKFSCVQERLPHLPPDQGDPIFESIDFQDFCRLADDGRAVDAMHLKNIQIKG